MADQSMGYYTIGSTSPFVGKSLSQINQLGAANTPGYQGIGFNPQDFAKYLGISADTPLTAGQQLTYSGGQSPGDTSMLGKIFTPETQAQVDQANAAANNQFIIQQNQPAVQALGSAVPIIQQQYQNTINDLTKSINQEYASRGVPTTSFSAEQNRAGAVQPVETNEASALQNIFGQIGQLQSGQPLSSLQLGESQGQNQFSNWLSQQDLAIQQAMAPFSQALAQAQANAAKYMAIPYVGAFNTQTGYAAPTTQQPTTTDKNGRTVYWVNGNWATTPTG